MLEEIKNIVFDTNYSSQIKHWWHPKYTPQKPSSQWSSKKEGFFDKITNLIFQPTKNKKATTQNKTSDNSKDESTENLLENKKLEEQIKYILNLPDEKYSDKLLTNELKKHITEIEKNYISSLTDYKSHIAPSYRETKWNHFNLSWLYGKTYYAHNYPSYVDFLWTRDVLWFHGKWDMSWFIYPSDSASIQTVLKRRATQLKAEISESQNKGITIDTEIEVEYRDIEDIRQKLTTWEEKYFETSFYTNIYNESKEKLDEESKKFEQKIWGYGIRTKPATYRIDEWFKSCTPLWLDELNVYRSMVSSSLAGSFPFISNDLIDNKGILYWVNLHTWSLVIFDRFSKQLPNANSVVLATSWAWKSFSVKLEILRYLLLDTDIIVIDPENEYKPLLDKVGGTYINIAVNSGQTINPFDLPPKVEDVEYWKWDLLRSQIMNLIWLIWVLIGWITPEEEALLDKAIQSTYALKDITFEDENPEWKTPPIMEDLLNVLEWMDGWEKIAIRLSKYVTWTFWKLFNSRTNVELNSELTVFSIRDLEDALKTPWMFNVLNFIWSRVRSEKKKRLLIVDEAWIMLQHEMSAEFLFWLIKRARKYKLWVTTISQDIEDFVNSSYWKPIISNSSMQMLLKQSTSSIKSLDQLLWLSEAEKQRLVSANVWEGLFFAGNQHVGLKILASPQEKEFIET